MSDNTVVDVTATTDPAAEGSAIPAVLSDLLVEDVSIDGMCGVY